jgi:mono/diheme cytochrome c family protein
MKKKLLVGVLFFVAWPWGAMAQTPPALDAKATAGRDLFTQHCGVCHVKTLITATRSYGPSLSSQTLGGLDDVLRAFISDGDSNMPGFKLSLAPDEIGSIVTYLKTLPAPSPASSANPPAR